MTIGPDVLLGRWLLDRTIDDRAHDEASAVAGVTELSQETDGRIRWHESGTLTRGDLVVPVTRTLFIERRSLEQGLDGWFVTFDDGRDFHPWEPGHEVVHPCSPDTYVGRVDVVDDDRWTVEWRVTGPAKDYSMTSTLTRAEPHPNENA